MSLQLLIIEDTGQAASCLASCGGSGGSYSFQTHPPRRELLPNSEHRILAVVSKQDYLFVSEETRE